MVKRIPSEISERKLHSGERVNETLCVHLNQLQSFEDEDDDNDDDDDDDDNTEKDC